MLGVDKVRLKGFGMFTGETEYRRMMQRLQLPGRRSRRKTEINGCSVRGDKGRWCDP